MLSLAVDFRKLENLNSNLINIEYIEIEKNLILNFKNLISKKVLFLILKILTFSLFWILSVYNFVNGTLNY